LPTKSRPAGGFRPSFECGNEQTIKNELEIMQSGAKIKNQPALIAGKKR
jgi:hypothetical protein